MGKIEKGEGIARGEEGRERMLLRRSVSSSNKIT
jgi:hypothetical protein